MVRLLSPSIITWMYHHERLTVGEKKEWGVEGQEFSTGQETSEQDKVSNQLFWLLISLLISGKVSFSAPHTHTKAPLVDWLISKQSVIRDNLVASSN